MTRFSHVALNCRRLGDTEEFYTRWFGFRRTQHFDLGGSQIVFLRSGDVYLELFGPSEPVQEAGQPTADGPPAPGTVRHIAFQTADVDEFVRAMGPAARITLGPLDFDGFIPGWRTVWLADPDGVVVEVSQGYRDPQPGQGGHGER
ncbi:VOC family protein [Micromonospora sp. NPDC048898]|uniref:VOC family protein n=1 Tax=Micromonospora sp. NPDC048898 TaxID=3364260 RepID=UPI00371C3E3F